MKTEHIPWKRLVNPDYLGAYALDEGQDMILTIESVGRELVTSTGGKKEQCVVAHFVENVQPMILNVTNMKTIQKVHGTKYIDQWVGKKIQVFQDTTRFGGDIVECLRIRPFVPAEEKKVRCERCGEFIAAGGNMSAAQVADYARKNYGKALCVKCCRLAREAAKARSEGGETVGESRPDSDANAGDS